MSNIVYLLHDADAEAGGRIADRDGDRQVPLLLDKLDDCIVKIAGLRDAVGQALDTSRTALDNLDARIAAIPDPKQRAMLENKREQAREVVLVNSRAISHALEFMAASAQTIRGYACEIVDRKTHPQGVTGSSGGKQDQT